MEWSARGHVNPARAIRRSHLLATTLSMRREAPES